MATKDQWAEFKPAKDQWAEFKSVPPSNKGPSKEDLALADPSKDLNPLQKLAIGAGHAVDRTGKGLAGIARALANPDKAMPEPEPDENEALYQKYHPGGLATVGSIGAEIGMSAAPLGIVSKMAHALRFGRAASLAADVAGNAGYSAATNADDRGYEALAGGGGALLGPLVLKALRGAKPGKQAQTLLDAGIQPSFGQVVAEDGSMLGRGIKGIEGAMESLPVVGSMLRSNQENARTAFQAATRKAALPAGSSPPQAMGTVDELGKLLSDHYETTLGKVKTRIAPMEVDDLLATGSGATPRMFQRASDYLSDVLPDKPISAKEAQQIEARLKEKAWNYTSSIDPEQREFGELLKNLAAGYAENWRAVVKASHPDIASEVSALDKQFQKFVPLRRAAAGGDLSDPSAYTPKILLRSIRQGDKSLGKVKFVEGNLPQQELAKAAEDILGSESLKPSLRSTIGTAGSIAGGVLATAPTAAGLGGAAIYALPSVQRWLTGQAGGVGPISQKAFVSWFDKQTPEAKRLFLSTVSQAGRAVTD